MKCIACGREMLDRKTYYQCSNILCDWIEEIENKNICINLKPDLPCIVSYTSVRRLPSTC